MILKLKSKLSLAFAAIIILVVAVISIFTNFLVEYQFKDYIIKQQNQKNHELVTMVGQQLKNSRLISPEKIESIGIPALEQGLILKVKDKNNKVVWDATKHNNGLCMQMMSHMAENMKSRYPNFDGGYLENNYPVLQNGIRVGTVEIGYYGPFYFTDNDLKFINSLNQALIIIGFLSLLLALIIAGILSNRLTKPISRVIKISELIKEGYYNDKLDENSTTEEILQLTKTINNLAGKLQAQELLRKQMSADVAHELRTPLSILQSHMEAFIDGIWEPNTERFKSCNQEIIRINKLVGDIENVAKYDNENLMLEKTKFNLYELVNKLIKNFEIDFMNKNIKIKVLSNGQKEKAFNINADINKLTQLFINIISNAVKYTNEGGSVNVIFEHTIQEIKITFWNSGEGISADNLPYIFERFYRVDQSRNRLQGGSGLGLTIAKAIAEAHGGNIKVDSRQGEYTEFTVLLPK